MTAYAPSLPLPGPRLVRAEILKLRKRRGLMITSGLLTIGVTALVYLILSVLHAVNPDHHGPAGGISNLGHGLGVVSLLGAVVATLIGASAGAGDLNAGVFRELVVTGRSRTALFLARVPGGLAVLFTFIAVAYTVAAVATVVFAGSLVAPSTGLLIKGGLWALLEGGFYFLLALGFASLIGSRSTSIGVLVAWRLAVGPILMSLSFLGLGREVVPAAGLDRLIPAALADNANSGPKVATSLGAALLVLVLWTAIALGVGAWRTRTRDA